MPNHGAIDDTVPGAACPEQSRLGPTAPHEGGANHGRANQDV